MSSAVVFLDLDGVLNDAALRAAHRVPTQPPIDPKRVAILDSILDATGAGIVFVTGWRLLLPTASLERALRVAGLRGRVIDSVGDAPLVSDTRAVATVAWLDAHREVDNYVILDDVPAPWIGRTAFRAALVAPQDGLDRKDASQAIALIKRPRKSPWTR